MELKQKILSHLPNHPEINIEFQDLSFSVPLGRKGKKFIIRNVSGSIASGQLTAILGPSGAGKSTLLNILAGYKSREATGLININGEPRNMHQFRRMSRYIMQDDLLQPLLTVQESMLIAADLKLSRELSKETKQTAIDEILDMLRLLKSKNTTTDLLSGGEKKRLSIALELVNNPPLIFLDEPTSGLDDLSSSQCISLLKHLADGGRTVVCSIHSPSARLFEMFDHVYILAQGQCVYQGIGTEIVPFLQQIGISCPLHYNPADFVIEVASGEYGEFVDKMLALTDNGKSFIKQKESLKTINDHQSTSSSQHATTSTSSEIFENSLSTLNGWEQCKILLYRMLLQTFRNTTYLLLKMFLYIFLGLVIGCLFLGMGNDGSKSLFNFGFCFTCLIVFMYCSLLPVLLNFPTELQLIKRENFNRWYSLGAYFFAMTIVNIPTQFIFGSVYVGLVFVLTDQPMEFQRLMMFFIICILVALISESIGLAISSTLNILNGMFVGPTLTVPLMLLAVYGYGGGYETIPLIIRIAMSFSYLRYGMEGLTTAIYGYNRSFLPCPEDETYCLYKYPVHLMKEMGMGHAVFWFDVISTAQEGPPDEEGGDEDDQRDNETGDDNENQEDEIEQRRKLTNIFNSPVNVISPPAIHRQEIYEQQNANNQYMVQPPPPPPPPPPTAVASPPGKSPGSGLLGSLFDLGSKLLPMLKPLWGLVKNLLPGLTKMLGPLLEGLMKILPLIPKIIDFLKPLFSIPGKIIKFLSTLFDCLKTIFKLLLDGLRFLYNGLKKLLDLLPVLPDILSLIPNIIEGLWRSWRSVRYTLLYPIRTFKRQLQRVVRVLYGVPRYLGAIIRGIGHFLVSPVRILGFLFKRGFLVFNDYVIIPVARLKYFLINLFDVLLGPLNIIRHFLEELTCLFIKTPLRVARSIMRAFFVNGVLNTIRYVKTVIFEIIRVPWSRHYADMFPSLGNRHNYILSNQVCQGAAC